SFPIPGISSAIAVNVIGVVLPFGVPSAGLGEVVAGPGSGVATAVAVPSPWIPLRCTVALKNIARTDFPASSDCELTGWTIFPLSVRRLAWINLDRRRLPSIRCSWGPGWGAR